MKVGTKQSIAVNFLYNMIYQISLVILPLITSPYLSRVVGPEGLGSYSYSYSVAYYFYLFGMLGINNYGNRKIAAIRDKREKIDSTFSQIFLFQLFSSSIATVLYILYCVFLCKKYTQLAFAQSLYVISSMISIDWFFFGIEEFRITVIRKTFIKIATSIGIFIFIKSINDLLMYALIISGAELLGEAYLWVYLPRFAKIKRVPIKAIFSETTEIIVLFIPIIATSIYRYMDKVMLGMLSSMNNVGQYDYAEKIIMICLGCMTALGTVMLPKMANLMANNKTSEIKKYLISSMQFAMFMACGITFGLSSVATRFSIVYFGENYRNCGIALLYLSTTVIPIAWANVVRTQYLIPSAKDKEYVISVIVGAILNFIFNYTFIPRMGIKGAIIGTITAEFSVAVMQTFLVKNELDIDIYIKNSIPFLCAGIIMAFVTRLIGNLTDDNVLGLLVQILFGGSIYILLSISYCILKKMRFIIL